jgi:hypothetical protein
MVLKIQYGFSPVPTMIIVQTAFSVNWLLSQLTLGQLRNKRPRVARFRCRLGMCVGATLHKFQLESQNVYRGHVLSRGEKAEGLRGVPRGASPPRPGCTILHELL